MPVRIPFSTVKTEVTAGGVKLSVEQRLLLDIAETLRGIEDYLAALAKK